MYRGAWLAVALPLLLAAFTVAHPSLLERPLLPPTFSTKQAEAAVEGLTAFPDRRPGTPGAARAARWVAEQLQALGFETHTDTFFATIPGRGRVELRNVSATAVAPTSVPETIVVAAHRDNTGDGPGRNNNASGTAALLELARTYGHPVGTPGRAVSPQHPIVFLSTDGGSYGALGADHFASRFGGDVAAVVDLDSIAGHGPARLEIGGDRSRSPAAELVATAAARIEDETGSAPGRTSAFGQLVDLAFPFSLYEQAPFVGRGIPALTLTTGGDRPPSAAADRSLDLTRLGQIGRAAQGLVTSLDQGVERAHGTSSYVYLGSRIVRGWAIELSLFAMLVPFLVAVVDLFARCRRRGVQLAPAFRSYRSRLGFWLWAGLLFALFALAGAFPDGAARPLNPNSSAAGHWPRLALGGLAVLLIVSWLVPRQRLRPTRSVTAEEQLAGHTAALLALGVVALLVVATNPFALVFLLPPLHAWLWLPQLREREPWLRTAVLLAGFLGPFLLLASFSGRYGLGLDSPWYVLALTAVGYVPIVSVVITLAWLAAAGQLVALTAGRYAPYPRASERPPRGPIRNAVRAVVLTARAHRRSPRREVDDVREA